MKKIIVFGATGNIGAYFVDYCVKHLDLSQYQVIAVGRKNTTYFARNGIEYTHVDIRNKSDFDSLPYDGVFAIINLTGLLPAYNQENNIYDYIDTNIIGSINIMEYARKACADRVIYSQTWAELAGYWGNEAVLSPDMPRKLLFRGDHAFYTISKSMVVDTMECYHQQYNIKNFIIRLPNVYLYSPQKTYYVDGKLRKISYRYMIDQALSGKDIEMWGNPNAYKDIIYVKDLCQMMYKAVFANVDGGIYHAGTGVKVSLREQIEGIIEIFSPNKISKIIYCPEKESFTSFVMNIDNAKKDLGYSPKYDYRSYLLDYKKEMNEKRFSLLWNNK